MNRASQTKALDEDIYSQTQADIRALKSNFADAVVAGLAREVLERLVERDVFHADDVTRPSDDEVAKLCHALISSDEAEAAEMIHALSDKGASLETIYLKHLAAAARMLGEWWNEDRISFLEVTFGTGRMVALMRGLRHVFRPKGGGDQKRVVFASLPKDTHTLGVRMASDLFRAEGWNIELKVGLDHEALLRDLEQVPCDILGLSFGGRHSMDELSRLVLALRVCCPHTLILICGHIDDDVRPLVELTGVDSIVSDIDEARYEMKALWNAASMH